MWPQVILAAVLVGVLTAACGQGTSPAETPTSPAMVSTAVNSDPWESLVKAAQKEGTVNIYGTAAMAPVIEPIKEGFRRRFGINLEFVQGRPPEVLAKLTAERRAGLYLADVSHLGETSSVIDVKPLGITVPVSDLLVLPEVKNPQNWLGGRLPFLDKDQHVLMFMASAFPQAIVNTDMVKEGDLTSFQDLLNVRWKGKIVFNDPTVSGGSPNTLAAIVKTLGREKALAAFRELATQEPVFTRNDRLLVEWVARGRYPIGLGYSATLYSEFKAAGASLRLASFKEPRHVYGGAGTLTVFDRNPNPRATQLYLNWLLSREGATIWSRATGAASARTDVSKEWVEPEAIARAEDVFPDEEQLQLRLEMREISAEIFGNLLK